MAEGIHKIKCKYGHDDEKMKPVILNTTIVIAIFNIKALKNDLIEYKCFCSNKNYQKMFHEKLKKQFVNTYKFSNHDVNKFILLVQEVVYLYE